MLPICIIKPDGTMICETTSHGQPYYDGAAQLKQRGRGDADWERMEYPARVQKLMGLAGVMPDEPFTIVRRPKE